MSRGSCCHCLYFAPVLLLLVLPTINTKKATMELFLMRAHPQHCIDPAPAWNWWLARDAHRLQDSPHRPWWGIEVHCTDSVVRYNENLPSSSLSFTSAPAFILFRLSASADFLCSSRTFGRSLLLVNLSPPLLTIHEKMCLISLWCKIFLKRAKLCPTWRGQVSLLLQGGALV